MTNRASERAVRTLTLLPLTAGVLACALALPACKEEAPPPPPPPPPRAPQKVDAQAFATDPRVQFPFEHAPTDESLAKAVADLASALAQGDETAFGALLDNPSRQVLAEQVRTGAWERETADIEAVRVVSLTVEGGATAVATLAVQDPRGAYLLAWKGVRTGDAWLFGGAPSPDTRAPRASDLDGAAASALSTSPTP